jgi:hypothetical protein
MSRLPGRAFHTVYPIVPVVSWTGWAAKVCCETGGPALSAVSPFSSGTSGTGSSRDIDDLYKRHLRKRRIGSDIN